MDELTRYIFIYQAHLMTEQERAANRAILGEEKAHGVEGSLREFYRKHLCSTDPEVMKLVAKGREKFIADVVERILREQYDEVVFNRCPKCQALARTPTAKQCPKCFYSWHGEV
jgi:hypothetical protein